MLENTRRPLLGRLFDEKCPDIQETHELKKAFQVDNRQANEWLRTYA